MTSSFQNQLLSTKKVDVAIVSILSLMVSCELLLYFQFVHPNYVGYSITLARLLQIAGVIVLIPVMLTRRLSSRKLGVVSKASFFLLLFYISYSILGVFFLVEVNGQIASRDGSTLLRPLIEIILAFGQIALFVALPSWLIRTPSELRLYLKVISLILFVCTLLGLLDFFVRSLSGVDLISRHLSDGRDVGIRFHGLFGEPRDALPALALYAWVVSLRSMHEYNISRKFQSTQISLAMFAMLFTFSFSFVIGILITCALILAVLSKNIKTMLQNFIISITLFCLAVFVMNFDERLLAYFNMLPLALAASLTGDFDSVPVGIRGQMPNIYSVAVFLNRAFESPFLFLFGSGLGSSSLVNYLSGSFSDSVVNAHSNIARYVIDFGFLGTTAFIVLYLRTLTKTGNVLGKIFVFGNGYLVFGCLVVGMSLAQRSPTLFIAFGLLVCQAKLFSSFRKGTTRVSSSDF